MKLPHSILSRHPLTWWRFILAFALILVAYFATFIIIGFFDIPISFTFTKQVETFLMFASIAVMHFAIALGTWVIYRRGYFSYINPLKFPIRNDIKWAVIFVVSYMAIYWATSLILFPNMGITEFVWQPAIWAKWLLPMAIIILLQTSAEEFLMRGFLQQYMAALLPQRWFYILLPALVFTSLHYWNFDNPAIIASAMIEILVIALIYGDWADRSRSLVGPITLHFANNFILVMLIGNNLEISPFHIFRSIVDKTQFDLFPVISVINAMIILPFYFFIIRPKISSPE